MKWGTLVGVEEDFSPPRSTEVKTNWRTPDARAASTKALPWRSSPPPAGVVTPKTPQIGCGEAWAAALKMAGESSRLPWTILILEDFRAREVAEEEAALRVRARRVKFDA